ncbi:MAG: FAD:protein FMN transferase [Treponema sp.]|nr:FAD:protein FMN transferase [Treponema sp.]
MKTILKNAFAFGSLFFVFLLASCGAIEPRHERVLGTVCFVNLYEKGSAKLYDAIFDRLNQIDDEFNLNKPESSLSLMNAGAFDASVVVSADVFYVLKTAKEVAALSDGVYDPSIQSIARLWAINSDSPRVPSQAEIDAALPAVDYTAIELNEADSSVRFTKPGVSVDLGSIAKGFAADEIAEICKKNHIKRAVIDLGGNVYVYGKKKKNELWRVGIKNPEDPQSSPFVSLLTTSASVVTSGAYERFFEADGVLYHHIFSTKDGYPVHNDILSATVVCEKSILADALSTTAFALGSQNTKALLPQLAAHFKTPIGVVLIKEDHAVWVSDTLSGKVSLLYGDWRMEK